MSSSLPLSFSREEWARLWAEDPAAAEVYRKIAVDTLIASAPERLHHKLECVQWRVDQERHRHDNPMGSAAALTKMAVDVYSKPGGLSDQILGPLQEADKAARKMSHPETSAEKSHLCLTLVVLKQEE